MKTKASTFLKQIVSVVTSLIKAKSMAVKNKTNAMRARLIILGLLKNKKVLLPSISHKIHALLGHDKGVVGKEKVDEEYGNDDQRKALIVYDAKPNAAPSGGYCTELALLDYGDDEDEDDKYPDLTHSLFDELEFDNGTESVIDLVKSCREDASDFRLEDEIDHVADVFIRRFHKRMRMQKLESFKRYKEMLDRSL
ncbi:hypothetical protein H6P81_013464 [Aristolochia fimbriata]|uniref:DUF761 domain-containing protein n=1 Tax=Aristolochia fimbriata TaxID=158543 RepID=A0AAV7EG20_ARIFI|nr:hypothetical protein H6P81_013464 [Aristolochia fimbriata]